MSLALIVDDDEDGRAEGEARRFAPSTLRILERQAHHKERTAAALEISLKTLYNKLRGYRLHDGGSLS